MSGKDRNAIWPRLFAAFFLLIGIPSVLMWGLWNGHMSRMMGMMRYGWEGLFLPLTIVILLALIAFGSYYLITGLAVQRRSEPETAGKALEILKERYARGEITQEQYVKMREELES